MIAVPAILFDLTQRATWLGFSSLVGSVPAVLLTPYAGVVADRISRKHILIVTQSVQMCASFTLFLLYTTDQLTPWRIVGVGFANGIATGFGASTWQAFVPSLVPETDMLDAVRLNSVQFTVARAIGPGFAGLVIGAFGSGAAILLNSSTFLLVILVLLTVNSRPTSVASRELSPRQAFVNGARYVWTHVPLRTAVLLAFASSALGQSLQFIAAAVSARIFDRPSTDSAGLMTSLGVGAILASLYATRTAGRWKRSQTAATAMIFYALSPALIALSGAYWVGLIGYFVGGLAHLTMALSLNTLIQGLVPDRVRGRAMSFYLLGVMGGIPTGSFIMGFLGDAFSLRAVIAVDALVFVAILAYLNSSGILRQLDVERLD